MGLLALGRFGDVKSGTRRGTLQDVLATCLKCLLLGGAVVTEKTVGITCHTSTKASSPTTARYTHRPEIYYQ